MTNDHKNRCWQIFWRVLPFLLVGILFWVFRPVDNLLHTDMNDLLPIDNTLNEQEKAKLSQFQKGQQKQILLLVSGENPSHNAAKIADLWQQSGLFSHIIWQENPDLAKLKKSYQQLTFRTLSAEKREQLLTDPARYFSERATELVNPFSAPTLLPPAQDWLGLSRFPVVNPFAGKLQWQQDGTLLTTDSTGKSWLLLRAELKNDNGIIGDSALLPLLQQTEKIAPVLMTGSAILAAEGKTRGEKEGRLMTLAGLTLTLLLAASLFRRWRIVWVLLPVMVGGVIGFLATVAICGGVHLLTLVIASSLIGLLLDFPLHWLGKSIFPRWRAGEVLAELRRPFFVSLLITLVGYAFLLATDLPILRQTAIFSLFAIPTAWLVTLWLLPPLFATYQPRENQSFAAFSRAVLQFLQKLKGVPVLLFCTVLIAVTIDKSKWQDDIRQWVHVPEKWLVQTQAITQRIGIEPAAQTFLITGKNTNDLLARDHLLTEQLEKLKKSGKLQDYNSLSQWVLAPETQKLISARLKEIAENPQNWAKMTEIGIPSEAVKNALIAAANPPLTIDESLQSPLATRWRGLYFGDDIAAVRLFGVRDRQALAEIDLAGVRFIDQRQHVNALFNATRNEALWLKFASYGLAALILFVAGFHWRAVVKILAVPFAAALLSVSVLTLLQIPISLFVAFALLLISAVGVDYAVYAASGTGGAEYCFAGMLPAALTTITTFGILAFSSTPAVAAFGLTVAIGIGFSLLFATWILPPKGSKG